MPGLATYLHTLRYLRPVQFYGRLWFRTVRPRVDLRPAPSLRALPGPWQEPARRRPSMTGPDRLRFLNEEHSLGASGWDPPSIEKLWRYNLHYFDDLNAEDAGSREAWHEALLRRWIAENPPGTGTGWEPYPTSLRIVNWIKWSMAGHRLTDQELHSLAVQARWLRRRLEIHLLANHLLANAKALVFAGLFFSGDEAEEWLERGLAILERELPEQILADGGQFERSPMYHALALEDVLDLVNIASAANLAAGRGPAAWRARLPAMLAWSRVMRHPDGEIAFFNDAAFGIAPPPEALDAYARRLGIEEPVLRNGLVHLADSGYVRVERDDAMALLDVAPLSVDYLPGHAHADTLSFELSLFGRRVLVNSGTSRYGTSAERLLERGTAAHNTVVVDGNDSSEVWSGFRVGRRARPVGLQITGGASPVIRCAHDGYRWRPGHCEPRRTWLFESRALVVEDVVFGSFRTAEARFHLHPDVTVVPPASAAGSLQLALPEGRRIRVSVDRGGPVSVEAGLWHPEFGRGVPNQCLVVPVRGDGARTRFDWTAA